MADIDAKVIAARRKAADEFFDALWARQDLALAEKAVVTILLRHLNYKTGQCNPSTERIMERGALGHTTVRDALRDLRDEAPDRRSSKKPHRVLGVIHVVKGKGVQSNRYYFVDLQTESWSKGQGQQAEFRPTKGAMQQAEFRPAGGLQQVVLRPASRPDSDRAEFRSLVGRNPAPNTVRNLSPGQVEEPWEVSSTSREPVREDWR